MTKNVFGVEKLMNSATITGPAPGVRIAATNRVFQANMNALPDDASAAASVTIEVSLDFYNWLELATVALDSTTRADGFTSAAPWPYVRANLHSLSGQGASVDVLVGV